MTSKDFKVPKGNNLSNPISREIKRKDDRMELTASFMPGLKTRMMTNTATKDDGNHGNWKTATKDGVNHSNWPQSNDTLIKNPKSVYGTEHKHNRLKNIRNSQPAQPSEHEWSRAPSNIGYTREHSNSSVSSALPLTSMFTTSKPVQNSGTITLNIDIC